MTISIIGFGKIGQAVAANIINHGHKIIAIDINPEIKSLFEKGNFKSNEDGLEDSLIPAFNEQRLVLSSDLSLIRNTDAVIVAIPLLVDQKKQIKDTPFLNCFRGIASHLQDKQLIIIETSIPVGYGRNTVVEVIENEGKKHGEDFLLVHSPERIKSGSMLSQLALTPKIIGGVTKEAAQKAYDIYKEFFDQHILHVVDSIESAEFVKLGGMAYRDIAIAISNQLAMFAQTVSVNYADLIPLINTDGEANLLMPGIGVGGHCTPVYPYFLINNFRNKSLQFQLAENARIINDQMSSYMLSLIIPYVKKKTALLLGLAFRPEVKEDTFSTTYLMYENLLANQFATAVYDPFYTHTEIAEKKLMPVDDIYQSEAEVVILITAHKVFRSLDFKRLYDAGCRIFIDGRNAFERISVEEQGIKYFGVGK